MARNPVLHRKCKHIDIKVHYIRELVENRTIDVQYIPTEFQIADILTKALPKPRFETLRCGLMGTRQ